MRSMVTLCGRGEQASGGGHYLAYACMVRPAELSARTWGTTCVVLGNRQLLLESLLHDRGGTNVNRSQGVERPHAWSQLLRLPGCAGGAW